MAMSLTNASRCWKKGDLAEEWDVAWVGRSAIIDRGLCVTRRGVSTLRGGVVGRLKKGRVEETSRYRTLHRCGCGYGPD